jgi:hypothetical protein
VYHPILPTSLENLQNRHQLKEQTIGETLCPIVKCRPDIAFYATKISWHTAKRNYDSCANR